MRFAAIACGLWDFAFLDKLGHGLAVNTLQFEKADFGAFGALVFKGHDAELCVESQQQDDCFAGFGPEFGEVGFPFPKEECIFGDAHFVGTIRAGDRLQSRREIEQFVFVHGPDHEVERIGLDDEQIFFAFPEDFAKAELDGAACPGGRCDAQARGVARDLEGVATFCIDLVDQAVGGIWLRDQLGKCCMCGHDASA
jgi:hypothetical protein